MIASTESVRTLGTAPPAPPAPPPSADAAVLAALAMADAGMLWAHRHAIAWAASASRADGQCDPALATLAVRSAVEGLGAAEAVTAIVALTGGNKVAFPPVFLTAVMQACCDQRDALAAIQLLPLARGNPRWPGLAVLASTAKTLPFVAERIPLLETGPEACRHALALVVALGDTGSGGEGSQAVHSASRSAVEHGVGVDRDALLAGAQLGNGLGEDPDEDDRGTEAGPDGIGAGAGSSPTGVEQLLIAATRQQPSPVSESKAVST